MLSLTCKNALKAVIFLSARSDEGAKASMKEIAAQIGASEHTVGKILQTLARQKIVNSHKGPTGGFFLDDEQQEQSLIGIVEAMEGENIFKGCGLGLSKCSESHPCPIHDEYKVARELMEKLFRSRKVRELRQSVRDGVAHLLG